MLHRWRSSLLLWLVLCLPVQGFAAVSGLWCAKMGFHAPTWVSPAGESALVHGAAHASLHGADHAGGHDVAPRAHTADFGAAAADAHCHVAATGGSTGSIMPTAAGGGTGIAADAASEAAAADPSGASCAQCAGCHASAMLPSAAAPCVAAAHSGDPVRWAPAHHTGPWPQTLERPPRALPR